MALYALRRLADDARLAVKDFQSTPPVLSPAKGLVWEAYTPPVVAPSPAELARLAAVQQFVTDRTAALAYAKLTALSNMTPAQIQSWVDANVTNLATAQDAIKTLAVGLSVLIRRERLASGG